MKNFVTKKDSETGKKIKDIIDNCEHSLDVLFELQEAVKLKTILPAFDRYSIVNQSDYYGFQVNISNTHNLAESEYEAPSDCREVSEQEYVKIFFI